MTVLSDLYFFHIPRTAGTSLRHWLLEYFAVTDHLECYLLEDLAKIPLDEINQYRFFSGHFGNSLYKFLQKPIATITWLRNPIDREISQYQYLRQEREMLLKLNTTGEPGAAYIHAANRLSLPEFCLSRFYRGYCDNLQVRYLAGIAPEYPTLDSPGLEATEESLAGIPYLECSEAALEAAKANLLKMMHFGLCEQMQESIALLCYRAALPPQPFDWHLNRTAPSDKTASTYSDEAIAILRELNQYDCALYEFAQAEFTRRWQALIRSTQLTEPELSTEPGLSTEPELSELNLSEHLIQNFQQVKQADKQVDRLQIRFSDAVFLMGWYPREYYQPLSIWLRWAGPQTESSVYAPLKPDYSYRICFTVMFSMSFDILKSLRLSIRGIDIPLEWTEAVDQSGHSCYYFTGLISAEVIQDCVTYTRLLFQTCEVVKLEISQGQVSDIRHVSFATDGMTIEPIAPKLDILN